MTAKHIGTAQLISEDGTILTAYQFENVATPELISGTQAVGGTTFWEFPTGKPLNTDDDAEFTDLDGRVFRLVSP
ncbi:hypothetical protein [Aurantimonas endophytica]|uniref:Uncharacterized protein n=1 Tax=Aurantimonas endophytica TaxID=1522175 RepID=A0A7W6HAI6_9HYPH|nr:hypothetical protein [Aurantimonas endophytica]MBB4001629.1 hypothetical protein [Aurantimonas endophytica]MCO6402734.1 hypothetical protein [Aurantimonas endophytica]